jgi:hypothetical protein
MLEIWRFLDLGLSEIRKIYPRKIVNMAENPKGVGVVEMEKKRPRGRPRLENTPLREYWRWLNERRKQRKQGKTPKCP